MIFSAPRCCSQAHSPSDKFCVFFEEMYCGNTSCTGTHAVKVLFGRDCSAKNLGEIGEQKMLQRL